MGTEDLITIKDNSNAFCINESNIDRCCSSLLTKEDFESDELKNFLAREEGRSLQEYLVNESWTCHQAGSEKCYLIKIDKHIIAFFTLSTDLIIDNPLPGTFDELDIGYLKKMIELLEATGGSLEILEKVFKDKTDKYEELEEYACSQYQYKMDLRKFSKSESNIVNGYNRLPTIMIKKYCKNVSYKSDFKENKYKLGTFLFFKEWNLEIKLVQKRW